MENNSYDTRSSTYQRPGVQAHTHLNGSPTVPDSWRDTVDHLRQDISLLWDKQGRLMQAEMNEKMDDIKVAIGAMASSGAFLLVGVFCFATTLIFALSLVVPSWAAAAIVTVVFFAIGGIMLGGAKKKLSAEELKPKRSIETLGVMTNTIKERYDEFKHH